MATKYEDVSGETPQLKRIVSSGPRETWEFALVARIKGKLFRERLDTNKLTIARNKLQQRLQELQGSDIKKLCEEGFYNLRRGIELYKESLHLDVKLGAETIEDKKLRCNSILKRLEESRLVDLAIKDITDDQLKVWAKKISEEFSPSYYNHHIGIVREIFRQARKAGQRVDDPTKELQWQTCHPKQPIMPPLSKFWELVKEVRHSGAGQAKHCANLIQFLAFGGFRQSEAYAIQWDDVDWVGNQIHVWREFKGKRRGHKDRWVPMNDYMKSFLHDLQKTRKPDQQRIMSVFECQKSLDRACPVVGIKRLTHHDFRHYFCTMAIEAGVDIPTIAKWLGHTDGGALLMKTYGHIRDAHSQEMARKISFAIPQAELDAINNTPVIKIPKIQKHGGWIRPDVAARYIPSGIANLVRVTATGEYAVQVKLKGQKAPYRRNLGTWDQEEALEKMSRVIAEAQARVSGDTFPQEEAAVA